jgi:hypothetical protein
MSDGERRVVELGSSQEPRARYEKTVEGRRVVIGRGECLPRGYPGRQEQTSSEPWRTNAAGCKINPRTPTALTRYLGCRPTISVWKLYTVQ